MTRKLIMILGLVLAMVAGANAQTVVRAPGAAGAGGGGNITIGGVTPALGGGATGASVIRVDVANDGDVAVDINDIAANTATSAAKLTLIESRLINAATLAQASLTQGDQVMFHADSSAPAAVTAGQAQRPWVDLNGRLHITTEKAEDLASANADLLDAIACIRDDTLDARSGTEGDYEPCHTNVNGAIWMIDVNSASTLTSVQLIDDAVFTDDAAFTPATSKGFAVGFQADEASTDSVDEGDFGVPRMTTDRMAYVVNAATVASAQAAVGCYLVSAASTNATNCKASAGNFYGVRAVNTTTTIYYLRMYNSSGTPTCSSATGFIESIPIPPASASGQAGGIVNFTPLPINYGTGVAFCFTGGSSSTDNTNAATGVFAALYYK